MFPVIPCFKPRDLRCSHSSQRWGELFSGLKNFFFFSFHWATAEQAFLCRFSHFFQCRLASKCCKIDKSIGRQQHEWWRVHKMDSISALEEEWKHNCLWHTDGRTNGRTNGLFESRRFRQRFNGCATTSCYLVEPIGGFNGHIWPNGCSPSAWMDPPQGNGCFSSIPTSSASRQH